MITKLLSFIRVVRNAVNLSEVKINTGGGSNVTAENFAPPGDDSYPLENDYVLVVDIPRTGGKAVCGYVDPVNTPVAQKGDKRIYARDAATGAIVGEVWLKNDGSILTSNNNGSNLLKPDGGSLSTTPASTFENKATGAIVGANGSGSFELQAGGTFSVNGVTIDPAGNITSPTTVQAETVAAVTSLTVATKEVGGHNHTQPADSAGDNQSPTDPM